MNHKRCRGLTLIELLVVIGVISILAALLIPAVQAARRSAQRLNCLNNLKQIGLALNGYHGAVNCLPPGRFSLYDPRFAGVNPPCSTIVFEKSLLLQILPYLEQSTLYNAINNNLTIVGQANSTVWAVPVPVYSCPSDPGAASPRLLSPGAMQAYFIPDVPDQSCLMSYTSYAGCFGSLNTCALQREDYHCVVSGAMIAQNNGCFNDRGPVTFASITDGLAQTALIGERALGTLRVLDSGYGGSLQYDHFGWAVTGTLGSTLFTGMYPPNSYTTGSTSVDIIYGASSYHPGGVHVLMGDGSARFVKETVQSWSLSPSRGGPAGATYSQVLGSWQNVPAPGVWQALCTRAGAEVVSTDDL